jgi:hypothetical protein
MGRDSSVVRGPLSVVGSGAQRPRTTEHGARTTEHGARNLEHGTRNTEHSQLTTDY